MSVLKDSLQCLSEQYAQEYEVVALVHKKNLFNIPNITYYEFPRSKSSWLARVYYEYFAFGRVSRELSPFLWLSLHDITPNVVAERRAVYCHNGSPFYSLPVREALLEPSFALFNLFYSWLYRINIEKNDWVIVQQDWIRKEFRKRFGINNMIVAHPAVFLPNRKYLASELPISQKPFKFIYPFFPRVFKNAEIIIEAARLLQQRDTLEFEIYFTIDGTENRYSKHIAEQSQDVKCIKFIGLQTREEIFNLYEVVDCLIFPSRLETWGMPITEFKQFNKPILLADVDYAYETAGDYSQIAYFNPKDPVELADHMSAAARDKIQFSKPTPMSIAEPYCSDWKQLFEVLLSDTAK